MTDWIGTSEVVVGLVLQKRLSPDVVDPTLLALGDYRRIIIDLRDGAEMSDLMKAGMFNAIQTCKTAAEIADEALPDPHEWLSLLEKMKVNEEVADTLEKEARRLRAGDDPHIGDILVAVEHLGQGKRTLRPASEIEPATDEKVWVATGWKPIDDYVGGIPQAGLIIVGGPPGTGKTGLAVKMMCKKVKKDGKKALMFSAEMTGPQVVQRLIDIEDPNKKVMKNIYISEAMMNVDAIYAEASLACSSEGDVGLIVIDFADLIIQGESNTGNMEHVYRTTKWLAKQSGVPVLLIAQLNEGYTGGPPKINHLRWSRLAEGLGDLILLIYNPNRVIADHGSGKSWLPTNVPDMGYIIVGKSKFGTKQGGVGAIQLNWDGRAAWGDKECNWFYPDGGNSYD